jgi:hypothetical protein
MICLLGNSGWKIQHPPREKRSAAARGKLFPAAASWREGEARQEKAMTIKKVKEGYRLVSKKGKNLGTYDTKEGAEKRERQVQYFKHHKGK